MELKLKNSFYRDISAYSNRPLLREVYEIIQKIEKAKSPKQIPRLKKLRKYKIRYRIKLAGKYRIGLIIKNQKVWLVRFAHRNDFYSKFP